MVTLAQTAYSSGLTGWEYPEPLSNQGDSMGSIACNTATLGANDPIHVDRINGSDAWAGTAACPKASITSAVGNASAGDEIIVHAGIYHENITIDNKDNLLLRAASGERVVMDGTRGISDDFDLSWDSVDGDGIQEVTLPQSGWQLFLNRTEQVPARWPNAAFSNNSVFNRTYWAEGTLTNSNNAYTLGWLQDAGPESGIHDGLNETINATGLDPVGAIAILNVGSFKSYSREITSWNPSNGTFGYDGTGMSWKTKHHAYFLEGKRELIDVDGEWWLNSTNNRLHYRPPSGQDANDLDLRVKVQPFAITVQNSDGVSIEGIDFFGTTIKVDQCDECTFANSTLEYPSTSRRSQGIAGESADERFVTHFYRCTNTLVDAVSITNTDGAAIEFHGAAGQSNGNIVNNSYFHAIDWSSSDQKGLMTTIYEGGRDMTFSNNTVHLTGASSVLSIGDSPTVIYNEVWDVGHLQTDGAVVQLMQGEVEGSEIAYNWIHDIGKYGIRFDAPIGQSSTGNNGSIHHNVIWNASGGIMAKGDYHDISNNTVFGNQVDGKNNIIILHESNTGNENSTIWHNAADAIAAHRSNAWPSNPLQAGTYGNNWNGYLNASTQLGFEIEEPRTNSMHGVVSLNGDGTRVAVGASQDYAYKGSAKVYEFTTSNDTWSQIGNGIVGAATFEGVGASVALNETGDRMIVGAPGEFDSSLHGVALIYEYTSSNDTWWQMGDNITAASNGRLFGSAVAINDQGNRVVIGDWGNTVGGTNSGQVKLFEYSSLNNTWWQIGATFNGGHVDWLGYSLSMNSAGDRIAIGSPYDGGGATKIYQYSATNGTCWQIGSTITGITNSISGNSLSLDSAGNTLIVGEPAFQGAGMVGQARIFNYTASNDTWWQLGENITGTLTGINGNQLGYHVDIDADGDTVAIGTPLQDDSATNAGKVEVFRYSTSNDTWWQDGEDIDGFVAQARYGRVSLNDAGTRLAVGTTSGTAIDPVRIFSLPPENTQGIGYGPFVEAMLVDPDSQDFRPKVDSTLDQLDAGAYDAADNDPWDAGIEWTYSRSSNYSTGCTDSIALNYDSNAAFDDGNCRYLEANIAETVAILNQSIQPITFTESLSNFDFGTWSSGVSNGTTTFSQSWRKPAGASTDANYDFQDFAIAENGDQAIVFTQNHSGGSTPHSLALMYKPFNGSWSSSIIDNSTNTGFKPSIAIDRTGALHIAYIDNANDTIRYATNVSGPWAFSTLGDADWTDSHSRKTDIAIDPITDAVYIVHTMKDVGDSGSALEGARFHTNEGGSWVNETITHRGLKSGYDSQIALDSDGNIHVAYYLDQGSDLKIASRINGVWQNETIAGSTASSGSNFNAGNTPAIAIDSQDVIHIISMTNYGSSNKRLALYSGTIGSWTATTFGTTSLYRHSYNPSIAVDSNDAIHIAYHYGTTSKHLHYISNMSGPWSLETLDSSLAGWGARVSIDNNDDIHIAHSDLIGSGTTAHYLEMTKRTGSGEGLTAHPIFDISPPLPAGLSMNWRNGTITGTPEEFQQNTTYTVWANISEISASTSISIGVDWSLRPSVSGVSATLNTAITPITFEWNTTIWESRVTNGSDHPSSAINSNDAGKATDVAADSNGKTHVVSFDDNSDDLRYTTNVGGTWTSSLIHQSGNTGRHPSIVIDSNDMIHVVFVRQTGTSLMYMNKSVSATSWSSPTTISSDAWNKATGLALDEDDNLYVSWARNDANYKRQCFVKTKPVSSSTWSDLPGLYTHYQSENHRVRSACDVAVDSNKKVHIVAHDAASASNSGDLRYTTNVSGSWVSSDVRGFSSSSVDTGRLVQIAIDSNDKIHLSYVQDAGTGIVYHDTNSGGSWSQTQVVWGGDHPAIAIDSNDDVYIVAGSSGGLSGYRRAASSTGSFSYTTSPSCIGGCDEYTSVVADNNDDFHISFARHLNNRLGVSYEQGTGKGVKNDPGSWRPVISSISSCEVSPSLPQGLSINNARCTLSGTPTEVSSNQTYTVWANTSSGESFTTQIWLRVVQSPGAFEYNPENNILTNNTEFHLAPNFINVATGNGSTWQITNNPGAGSSYPGQDMELLVGDTLYFSADDGSTGVELWAHDTSNHSTWQVADISSGGSSSVPGNYIKILVGDTLYFSANDGSTGVELWAHDTSNHSTWQVADINSGTGNSNPGYRMALLVGDTLYFSAVDGSGGHELWAHDTSNHSTWQVADLVNPGEYMELLVGDTLYFSAVDGSTGVELWAHDTSNHSTWQVADINSGGSSSHSNPGHRIQLLVGDTIYFSADDGSTGAELWAHDTSNHSTWRVADINSGTGNSNPGSNGVDILVGDTIYFSATDGSTGYELWAHDTSNHSTWRVVDINSGSGSSSPGNYIKILVGDTLYFSANDGSTAVELWAHDTSNHSTWQVADIRSGSGSSSPGQFMQLLVGDTIYFDANDGSRGNELWAHDTSNHSTWQVADINSGGSSSHSDPGFLHQPILVGNTIYFSANDGSTGYELRAHNPSSINYSTNTGGDVTSWEINASLPNGLFIGPSNGTIYGTPTELWTQPSYMVWANNSAGPSVAYLNITVVDEVPILSYSPSTLEFTNNTAHVAVPLDATLTGSGTIISWTINGTLPGGINFGLGNGTIWGTPTELWNSTIYTVWANNSGGSTSTTITISVVDQVPTSLTITPENTTATNNTAIISVVISPNGPGEIVTWELEGELPDGLTWTPSNQTIWGTPIELMTTTQYTIWANNTGGDVSATLNITVNDQVPGLNISPKNTTATNNTAITTIAITTTGSGEIDTWELEGTLPSGLTWTPANQTIWGTPTELMTTTQYTIWANNTGGDVSATLNITVNDAISGGITISPTENTTTTNNTGIPSITFSSTGPGEIVTWELEGSLPSGLTWTPANQTIWGTPTELMTVKEYTVWANNSGGSISANLNITVNDQLPTLSYSPENLTLTKGQASSDLPLNATVTGSGAITSWAISPALPSGLSFGTSNGTIWGTPTSLMTLKTFTIWANNSGGSSSATVNITVNDELPNISYSPDWFVLTNNTAMSPTATPTNSGGAIPSRIIDMGGGTTAGKHSSIAIDSYGHKHISYGRFGFFGGDLMYATDKSGSWVLTVVDGGSSANLNEYTSISVDSNDAVHISYYDVTNTNLKYATCSSSCSSASSWSKVTVDSSSGDVGEHTSISVDSNDAVHISYYDVTNTNLKYATCSSSCSSASSWSKVTIESSSGDVGKYNSIAIDSNDALHISYRDSTNTNLKYATCSSSSCTSSWAWTRSTIDSVGNVGSRTSIAIDSNDAVHISYHDITSGDLKYATDQNGSWANTTVDSVGTVGQYTSIAIDSNDVVHISYYDATTKDLKYASNMQSSIQTGFGNVIKFIDRDAEVGRYSSIAVDLNGDVHISYYDATNGDLKYAALQGVNPWNVYGYSISPALPSGLSLNFTSGEISGTPTALSTNTTYTITARNTGGANTTTITIEVLDQLPGLNISPENTTATNNTAISTITITTVGPGEIDTWELEGTLPTGLTWTSTNQTIWGTPTELMATTQYTVWANNSGGAISSTFNITVNDQLPGLNISPENTTATNNTAITTIVITTVGLGEITSWELEGSLPSGLTWTSANQTIWGTPTELMTVKEYTVWANNSGGSISANLNITVNDQLPISLTITPENTTATNNTAITTIAITTVGPGEIVTWELEGTLPSGLTWTPANQSIWGTPTALMSTTQFTVWANNSGGTVSATLNITVNDQVPTLSYPTNTLNLIVNTTSSDIPLVPILTGPGEITSWEINGSQWPPGLYFESSNGTIMGMPNGTMSSTTFTVWANNSGGSTSTTVTIVIVDQVPTSLTISPENTTATNNSAIIPIVISSNGPGQIITWELEGTLPVGLTFTSSNQTIWGIPTELMINSQYTIWANNTGGSVSATLNITVEDQVPGLNISPENTTAINNTAIAPIVITSTGPGEIVTWELEGTLPSGLTWTSANQTIWGTPTELMPTVQYTIWANNSGGSVFATLNITVNDQVPGLNISPENTTAINNTAIAPITIISTGPGEIVTWELEGTLPSGLTWTSANQTIWGTPTELMPTVQYTIWANNSGGSVFATLNITVNDQVPTSLTFLNSSIVLTNNTAMIPEEASLTGSGEILTWEIDGILPSGIVFGSNNGTIWGTPNELWTMTNYTIWANNTGGSISIQIHLTVVDHLPTINYDYTSLVLTNNTADSRLPLNPVLSGPGEILTWQISGALPNGLVFSQSNGSLNGTPVELWPSTTYTIWANNSGGYRTFSLTLAVIDQVPSNIVFDGGSIILTNNTVMTPETPSITGPGEITSWEVNGTLPSGVNLDSNTGIISGTPTELWPVQTYTVWANNSGGSVEFTFDLTVIAENPDVTFPSNSLSLTVGQAMSPLLPSSDGGEVVSWEIEPALPDGLGMDSVTGEISGTPTTPQSTESYTIWANNTGGSMTQTLTITIVDVPATPSISVTEITLTIDEVMAPFTITITGGEVVEWGLHPELPLGLTFNEETGSISGIPTVLSEEQTYTIWANNSGGSQSLSFTIEVVDEPPIIEYVEEEFVLYANVTEVSIEAISSGGDVIGFSVSPELDNGLQFSDTNGTIWGIPDITHERMTFTVTATNSGGSSVSTVNITVLPSVGCTDSLAENYDPIAIEDDDSCVYTDTDGDGVPDIDEVFGCTDPDAFNHNAAATEDDGSCIAVLEVVYPEVTLNLTVDESVVAMIPTVYNQTVETWTVEPELPDGLEFNRLIQNGVLVLDKGTIQGIPTETIDARIFTVTATDLDTGQTATILLTIEVIDPNAISIGNNTPIPKPITDTDGDGYEDDFELECGTDPENSTQYPLSDDLATCKVGLTGPDTPPGNLFLWFLMPLLILILIALYTMIFLIKDRDEEDKEDEKSS